MLTLEQAKVFAGTLDEISKRATYSSRSIFTEPEEFLIKGINICVSTIAFCDEKIHEAHKKKLGPVPTPYEFWGFELAGANPQKLLKLLINHPDIDVISKKMMKIPSNMLKIFLE